MTDTNNTTEQNETSDMHTPGDSLEHHTHLGPILGVLVIMLVLILGGLYLWGGMLSNQVGMEDERAIDNNEPETPRAVADQEILGTVSSSDELTAIEADVNSTNLDGLDNELTTIDAEMTAGLAQ